MELRAYWVIVLRRWWLPALATAAAAIVSFWASPLTQRDYTATMRVLLSVPSEPPRGNYFTYDKYYSLLSTEYLTDDFIEVVRSRSFREDVLKELNEPPATALSITSQPRTERAPRILTVSVTAEDADLTRRAADAAVLVLTTRSGDYFVQLGPRALSARIIDPPVVVPPSAAGRNYLNIALRTLVGLAAGIGLTFLLHYLDPAVYAKEEIERLTGLPVLAEIPSVRRGK
ncbi:MAG: hypothetical protein EXR51_02855 [Dehalococcoidia bacterium]|nr:hypothetical protein [Dehalococcoidia bacterium]